MAKERLVARCVSVDGIGINFQESGAGDPVLLLHGLPTSCFLWRHVQAGLAAQHRVVAPDLVGFGRSDKAEYRDLSIPAQADVMARFALQLDVGPVTVVGHDLGAAVGLAMAARFPGVVSRLVLVNPPDQKTWVRMQMERFQPAELARKTTVEELLQFLRTSLPRQLSRRAQMPDDVLERHLTEWETPAGMGAFFQLARALDPRIIEESIAQLRDRRQPVLVVAGAEDELTDVESCRRLAEAINGATLEIIPDCGHLAPEEVPELLVRSVERFLAGHGAAAPGLTL